MRHERTGQPGLHVARWLLAAILSVLVGQQEAAADKSLEGIACRSVHLQYPAEPAAAFYNEVTVEQSAPGTYFCVCGFHKGYYGIQELADGKKLLIFSVWDPGDQNNPDDVEAEQRVKLLHQDQDVRVGRFGNEGTGGQSFYDFDWKVGETYRFVVTARPNGKRTEFGAYFFHPQEEEWKHLVTFSTLDDTGSLRGLYAFVEDFRRNRVSATKERVASYGPGWVMTEGDEWTELSKARFTADSNPVMNIDAGEREGRFFLATGGETRNDHFKLNEVMALDNDAAIPSVLEEWTATRRETP